MDTQTPPTTAAEAVGRFIGVAIVGAFAAALSAVILFAAWNTCVPQVFAGREVTLSQAFAMVAISWVITARLR